LLDTELLILTLTILIGYHSDMKDKDAILYIFSGLPDSGKTTLSQMLAQPLNQKDIIKNE
jgi:adenylylsulfate kinase-like enzyme